LIHESLLTTYSDFFRAALTGGFVEAEEKMVKLEEDRSQTFVFFVHWLYHQRLPDRSNGDADEIVKPWSFETDAAKEDDATKTRNLIQLRIFSDRYSVPQLARDTLDELFYLMRGNIKYPSTWALRHAFEHLREQLPLCRFLIHNYCDDAKAVPNDNNRQDWPEGFKWSVLCRYADMACSSRPKSYWKVELCAYHVHKTDEEKTACKQEQKRRSQQKRTTS
jgi:hypothetical protein